MDIKILIIIIIECIAIVSLKKVKFIPKNTFINIFNAKSKFFYRINFNIHTVTNQLFQSIQLDKNQINSERFQVLLLSHLSFNIVAQSNYKVYDTIKNVVKVHKEELDDIAQNVTDAVLHSPDYNVTRLSNITFYVDHFYSSIKENDDSIESFNTIWSKLSDRFIEDIIDPILEEDKKESIVANDTELISHYMLQDSKTWRDLLNTVLYFNKMAQKETKLYEELKNISQAIFDTRKNNSLQNSLQYKIGNEFDKLKNNSSKLAHALMEPERFYINNLTDQSLMIDLVTHSNTTLSKSREKIIENIIDQIVNENEGNISEQTIKANKTRRIFRGRKTKVKSYPFIASLHLMNEFLCAGSIISTELVLTAASCLKIISKNKVYRFNTQVIFARVGSAYTKRFGRLIPAADIIFHPEYDSVTLRNNLAIVKLLEPLEHMNKRKVKRIRYADSEDVFIDVMDVKILGWGAKDAKDKSIGTRRLSFARLDIYNVKDCEEIYTRHYVTESNFCAGFVSRGSGACMGDVGGPAIVAGKLVGVVSFGAKACGTPDIPTVFTKVSSYAEWIDRNINKEKMKENTDKNTANSIIYTTAHAESVSYPKASSVPPTKEQDNKQIDILKKLILELILVNNTAIDYVTDTKILDHDNKKNDEKVFIDLPIYNVTDNSVNVRIGENNATKSMTETRISDASPSSWNNGEFLPTSTLMSVSNDQMYDYEGNNTISTFEKSISESQSEELSLYDSSYYEIGIPIDKSPFEKRQRIRNIAIANKIRNYNAWKNLVYKVTKERNAKPIKKEIAVNLSKPFSVTRERNISDVNLGRVENNVNEKNLKTRSSLNVSFDLYYMPGNVLVKSDKPKDITTTEKTDTKFTKNKQDTNPKLENDADWHLESGDSLSLEDFNNFYEDYEDEWQKRKRAIAEYEYMLFDL